jgi:FPC/CPF motif-containing protein YcgG
MPSLFRIAEFAGRTPAGCPSWAPATVGEVARIASDPAFPCFFATATVNRNTISFAFAETATDEPDIRGIYAAIREYLDELSRLEDRERDFRVLVVQIRPERPTLTLQRYHDQAWGLFQRLHDIDTVGWPKDVPTNPADRLFAYCLAGVPLFINVSAAAHEARSSRNLGSALTLVINPRDAFDRVPGRGPSGDRVRRIIRERTRLYDGQPTPAGVGAYGDEGSREWMQYVLPETNARHDCETCPLVIRPRPVDRG